MIVIARAQIEVLSEWVKEKAESYVTLYISWNEDIIHLFIEDDSFTI
jgi:hypothetical protein